MERENIYLIAGRSGVGKTTLVENLQKDYGLKPVESYTTRPPRYPGETGHIFVTEEEFDRLGEMVAYTEYNGYRYGVTEDIVNSHDLYVIDPYGIQHLRQHYHGPKKFVVIELRAEEKELVKRMKERGDSEENIRTRLQNDAEKLNLQKYGVKPDLIVNANGIRQTEYTVAEYIRYLKAKAQNTHGLDK